MDRFLATVTVFLVLMLAIVSSLAPSGQRYKGNADGCVDRSMNCRILAPSQCYDPEEQGQCCATCRKFETVMSVGDGCEYGDRIPEDCAFVRSRHCRSLRTRTICCATCADYNAKEIIH